MIPLSDDNSTRKSIPIVTYTLIILNVLFFLLELAGGESFITEWSFVPSRFSANPAANFPTIFTAMFMHGGWAHIIGNMLYLWIFGDNVEDRMGKIPFTVFYLFCGVVATFAQFMFNPDSSIPNLGASGAIAGVLGAYLILFPGEKVTVLVWSAITQMPALLVIGLWFLLQFLSIFTASTEESGGVAYLAHIGGFIAGLIIAVFVRETTQANS